MVRNRIFLGVTGIFVVSVSAYGSYYYTKLKMLPQPHPNIRDIKYQQQLQLSDQVYDDIAKTYDDSISCEEFFMGLGKRRKELIQMAHGKTLELAAGTARSLKYYTNPPTTQAILTDMSTNMLEIAYYKLQRAMAQSDRKRIPEFKLAVANASSLPFKDNSFDTVIDCFGLCSIKSPLDSLKEMARVVKPDGRILLLEHGISQSYEFISNMLDKLAESHARKWGCWANRDIKKLVDEAGLRVVELRNYNFGTTYMIVAAKPHTTVSSENATQPHKLMT